MSQRFKMLRMALSLSRVKRITADFTWRLLTSSFQEISETFETFFVASTSVAADDIATVDDDATVTVAAGAAGNAVFTTFDGTISNTFPFCTATEETFGSSLRTGFVFWWPIGKSLY